MSEEPSQPDSGVEQERQLIAAAHAKGIGATVKTYAKLSGPGWLQCAITLGGGSLAASLYLGILGGFSLLWTQGLAMIFGIIMLNVIGYVTLSTGKRPFPAIRDHINPVLAWGWIIAVALANFLWCLPQYSLAVAAVQKNLLPGFFGDKGLIAQSMGGPDISTAIVTALIFLVTTGITLCYGSGGRGVRIYELVLKVLVGLVVLSFGAVVVSIAFTGGVNWSDLFSGFIPTWHSLTNPSPHFNEALDAIGPLGSEARTYWSDLLVGMQIDTAIAGAATAVGINMTFLFPYTLLKRGWGKEFRGLAIFDLSTGMLIPYILATTFVVMAAASQFHTKYPTDFKVENGQLVVTGDDFKGGYHQRLSKRMSSLLSQEKKDAFAVRLEGKTAEETKVLTATHLSEFTATLSLAEQQMAARLVKRTAHHLAGALVPVTGEFVAHLIFGIGVLAMAMSTISMLMLISGFVFCELFNKPLEGRYIRYGAIPVGLVGMLGPFFWKQAAFYFAVKVSVLGSILLPFAYITFFFMLNQRSFLGKNLPSGWKRLVANLLAGTATLAATGASLYVVNKKAGWYGLGAVAAVTLLAVVVHFVKAPAPLHETEE